MSDHLDPRRALHVTRYHSWPRIREQSVGEHSIQVMRILLAIWPEAPREMLLHCLTHDIGEVACGDLPYPIKRQNADLKAACDRIEREAHTAMTIWGLPPPVVLTEEQRSIFKWCEYVEMMEWAIDEMNLGNQEARTVLERCQEAIRGWTFPIEIIRERADYYLDHRESTRYD